MALIKVINKNRQGLTTLFNHGHSIPDNMVTLVKRSGMEMPRVFIVAGWYDLEAETVSITKPAEALKEKDLAKFRLLFEMTYVKVSFKLLSCLGKLSTSSSLFV